MSGLDNTRLPKKAGKHLGKQGRTILRQAGEQVEKRGELGEKETIHQLRVAMKRMRALLRLFKSQISAKEYSALNALCRRLANDLSSNRDADVAIDTLVLLASDNRESPSFLRLQAALQYDGKSDERSCTEPPDWRELIQALARIDSAYTGLPLGRLGRRDLKRGIKRGYRRGRQLWRRTRKHDDIELLHEWRKAVKSTYYQHLLLSKSDETTNDLKRLGTHLGDLHDLDLLEQRLLARRNSYWQEDLQWLRSRLEARRQYLLTQARSCGKRIYTNSGREQGAE